MQLLQTVAEYTLGQAYVVIKAISKKNKALMAENELRFKEGCLHKGLTQQQADQLWELILPFAGYSFNRPHSTLYGLLSYQTAWLKVHYPTEYMAAVLTGSQDHIEDIAKSANETRRLGVALFGPDINVSGAGFSIEQLPNATLPPGVLYPRGIRFGLAAIKNIGSAPIEAIIAERDANGPFDSLEDICARVDRSAIGKRVLENLVKAGALDNLPGSRRQKLAILEQALSAGAEAQKARAVGQASLFDLAFGADAAAGNQDVARVPLPLIEETPADKKEELLWEKELIGITVSEDPVAQALNGVDMSGVGTLSDINEESIGQMMSFIGIISGCRRIMTRKGDPMLVAELEDLTGKIELVAFPKVLARCGDLLIDDAVVKISAKIDNRRDTVQLLVEHCEAVQAAASAAASVAIQPEMDIEDLANDEPAMLSAPPPEAPAPPETPAPAMSNIIQPRARISLGQKNGNGHSESTAPASAAPGRALRLYLPRSENYDNDVRCMQEIDQLLRESAGNDRVMLYLRNGVGTVVLQPQHTISVSDALLSDLRGMLGAESVIVS